MLVSLHANHSSKLFGLVRLAGDALYRVVSLVRSHDDARRAVLTMGVSHDASMPTASKTVPCGPNPLLSAGFVTTTGTAAVLTEAHHRLLAAMLQARVVDRDPARYHPADERFRLHHDTPLLLLSCRLT